MGRCRKKLRYRECIKDHMKKVERFHETGGLHERGGEEGNSMEL